MHRLVRHLILVVAVAGALVIPLAQPASAAAGDSITTGCGRVGGLPYGVACDAIMKTNKCSSGAVAFRLLWANPASGPEDDRLVVFHDGTRGCNVKIRHRVRYGSGNPQWLAAVSTSANDEGWIGQTPLNRNLCWTDFSVQRKDGSWLTHRHYSPNWGRNASWRAACRTDA
ncbi:hypothetical protein ABFU82_15415 [Nocardioides sp. WV_118_6]|uniref:hypothetical protein n=1 Tax=Nocardioides simplex TaxID=2045 RepID=UPI00215066E7|nr:hypothetical protein [Pimelobacter simplex]UUW90087.1 hypothetical protein M0M43_00960 [Pimelobacter simplex]UUW93916.1 hypothetical protein M0M48_19470 [Pimelobacter simplex]